MILLWPKKGGSHGGPGLCLSGTEDANSPFWSPVHASVGPGQRWHFGAAVRIQVCPQEAARALYCMFGGLLKAICTIITIFLQPASGVPQAPAAVALEHPVVMGCSLPSAYRLSLSNLKSWQLLNQGSERVSFPHYHTAEKNRVSLAPVLIYQLWTLGHRRPFLHPEGHVEPQ